MLTPPDKERCQADVPGAGPFTVGGKIGNPRNGYRVRCENQPAVIVSERAPGADGLRGSMSLCAKCLKELISQHGPDYAPVTAVLTPSPDRFDAELGARTRDVGIARVAASTDEWQEAAVAAIRVLAQSRVTLTTDDVWLSLGRDAELEGRAMGAAMRAAAKLGYVRRTDRTRKSERAACHRRDLRVWESLLCR